MRQSLRTKFNRAGQICRPLPVLLLILMLLSSCSALPVQPQMADAATGSTGVSGIALKQDGSPASGAFVYAYRSARHGLRGPADFGVRVDSSGRYFLDLIEGEYYLVARLRQSGADAGPPRPGDAWSISRDNPVEVKHDRVTPVDFSLQSGIVPKQVRQGSLTTGDTGYSGKLVDSDGRPFVGAFALAYRSSDFHRMPELTSIPADENGRFVLYVPGSGTYCLAARTETRGQPRAGEPYGTLGREEAACRDVLPGEIIEIGTIVLTPYR